MRVFVAGATGAIGRPLVAQLVAAGHEVTGMTRSEQRAADVRQAGAEAVVCDALDADAVRAAMETAKPEVVVHQLTSLPDRIDFRKPDLYDATNRVRGEGTRNLIDGARAAGASRMVAQSIAFAYAPVGDRVKDEEAPLLPPDTPGPFGEGVRVLREMEESVTGTDGLEGLVLRYGFFYGPGTYYALDGSTAEDMRRRRQPIVGKGTGVFSFIHVDDAASATVKAVEGGPPGIYNVVDDDPATLREWAPAFAEAIGAPKPMRIPAFLARLIAGRAVTSFALDLRGASNAKARRELGWGPRYASWRQGFREALG
jgi:nucleoside-diphosphate-sugar epimerase